MNVKNRIILVVKAVSVLLLLSPISLFAQNLVTNGDFEMTTGFNYNNISDYTRITGGAVEEGKFIHDVTSANHGIGAIGWPSNLTGYGGSGYFLLFNGFGGSTNPTKAAWRQTIAVTPNTTYTFSAQVRNLAQGYLGMNPNPAIMRMKINGQPVGTDLTLPTNNNWQEKTATWNSGTATQAILEIVDAYTGQSSTGDDFGIDHISFTANTVYSATANADTWPLACLHTAVEIPVLDNDVVSPSIQNATVQIVTPPTHGAAAVLSNNKIQYVFTDNTFTGTDQLKYRVGFSAQNIWSEAWVYITTNRPPTVSNIAAPGPICTGGVLGIQTPTVTPSGLTGHWEQGASQTGSFQTFDPSNVSLSLNGRWVRYSVSNDCGEAHSNAVQITVTNGPAFTAQTPQVQPFCAGTNLSLNPPAFSANGSTILSQGWVVAPTQNGEYQPFNLNNVPATYDGWYIRYRVEGSCGYVLSDPAQQLTVNLAPDITGVLLVLTSICDGDDLPVTPPAYVGNGTGSWEICQTQSGTYQSFSIQNVPSTYDGWYLRYKVNDVCGSDVSNAVQIHVNAAPTIAAPAAPQAICAGDSFTLTAPTIQNNGATITNQGWQISPTQNGAYTTFTNTNVPYTNNHYWIRYHAENSCGDTHSTAVQVTVNDLPVVGNIASPSSICAGESFTLNTPQVDWRHVNQGTGSWEIAPTASGEFTPLTNSNIPSTYNGYYLRYKAVNGCGTSYSSNVVQVTVFSNAPTYDTITACDTYIWNGVTCNHSDNYQATVQSPEGCNITAHLHFVMSDAYTETQTFSSCGDFTWDKNGQTYTSTGSYDYTVESGNPLVCDSIFTLSLTVNDAPEVLSTITAPSTLCAGSTLNVSDPQYAMHHVDGGDTHWEYATSPSGPFTTFNPLTTNLSYGTYYIRFAVVNNCDEAYSNVVSFHVDDMPEAHAQLSDLQVCEGQTLDLPEVNVTWNNEDVNDRLTQWQMASTEGGPYTTISPTMPMQASYNGNWLRFVAHNTCGDDIVGPVRITVIADAEEWLETVTECDSYSLPSGVVITESTVVDIETYDPCYHVAHQPVVINHSDQVNELITSCHETYEWNGMTFYHSPDTQYSTVTLTNVLGCDSIVNLQLDFGDYAMYTHDRVACEYFVWDMNPGHVYTESVRDSVFVEATGQDDCDTWYFLNLTVGHESHIDGGYMNECSGFVWHGVPYYNDAILFDSLQTVGTHCDSIISYQLHIIPTVATDTNIVACKPIWWQEHYCETEGDYQHTFQSVFGCDSIVTAHFSLSEQLFYEFDSLSCEPFQWYEHQCNTNGMAYSHLFQTLEGCDSTVVMHVTLSEAVTTTMDVQACDYYELDGVIYDEPGVVYIELENLETQAGCDSIVQIRLEIKDSEAMGSISGNPSVYVASNLVNGVYRYEIDTTGVVGDVVWALSNPDWEIVESASDHCVIHVTTPGYCMLTANFTVADCGEMARSFDINAGYFGVEEQENHEVQVYPNPTKGTLHIEAEGIESIRLIDMMGQVLEMRDCGHSDSVILDLNGYAKSVYLLEIKTDNGLAKKRVILCR